MSKLTLLFFLLKEHEYFFSPSFSRFLWIIQLLCIQWKLSNYFWKCHPTITFDLSFCKCHQTIAFVRRPYECVFSVWFSRSFSKIHISDNVQFNQKRNLRVDDLSKHFSCSWINTSLVTLDETPGIRTFTRLILTLTLNTTCH